MTLHAVAHRRRMNRTLYVSGILVRVASETQCVGRGRNQLDVGCISAVADLVASGTAHGHCGMNGLALGLVFMAGDAGRGVRLRIKWNRMFGSEGATSKDEYRNETAQRAWSVARPGTRFE